MKKQHIDLVLPYWAPWLEKSKVNRMNFFRIENVPPHVVRKLMTGYPNARKMDKQNESPTLTTMVKICEKYNGTLEGYVIPVESGREDARISFDGFSIKADPAEAKKVKGKFIPDEFDEGKKKNVWRFWWD